MSITGKAVENPNGLMDRKASAAVRRGVAEVLRNARKRAVLEEASQRLPAKLQYLLNELQKRD